jgi:hypothetical protein
MTGNKYFLNACAGCFSEIPTPGQKHHTFEEITGRLLHIVFKDTKAGETMRLYVVDETNLYIISMFVKSRPAMVFFLTARNLNLQAEIKFLMRRENDKDFLSIHQFGNSIRWYFDQSNEHELPQGKDEKRTFLRLIVEEEIMPRLEKVVNPFPSHPIYKPLGSGNGLKGGYFGKDEPRPKRNTPVNDEDKAPGHNTRRAYLNRNRHFSK